MAASLHAGITEGAGKYGTLTGTALNNRFMVRTSNLTCFLAPKYIISLFIQYAPLKDIAPGKPIMHITNPACCPRACPWGRCNDGSLAMHDRSTTGKRSSEVGDTTLTLHSHVSTAKTWNAVYLLTCMPRVSRLNPSSSQHDCDHGQARIGSLRHLNGKLIWTCC